MIVGRLTYEAPHLKVSCASLASGDFSLSVECTGNCYGLNFASLAYSCSGPVVPNDPNSKL